MVQGKRKAALHSLGCKVNAYETEVMCRQLEKAGYEIVPFAPGADVYVINTCSVTNIADRKSRQMLHRAKKMNPQAVIVAAGCYVQTAGDREGLGRDADIILGNDRKQNLVDCLTEFFACRDAGEDFGGICGEVIDIASSRGVEPMFLDSTQQHTRAYIKIQDGCNQFCSYCIIPYARGRVRSRGEEEILREIGALAASGAKEIVLTGIHVSSYGRDTGTGLAQLLERACEVPGIERIRLSSLEPGIITPDFVEVIRKLPKLCPHFHLSLQSGCDSVLRRMNRRYDTAGFAACVDLLREAFDRPALTTDIIVGFPGETEEEFACTEEFLKKIRLYETHIFRYSMRRGTRAAAMPDQIEESVKAQRSARLALLDAENRRAFAAARYGEQTEVLFEETADAEKEGFPAGTQVWTGYTREYIRVVCPSEDDLANRVLTGTLQAPAAEGGACVFTRSDGPGAEN